MSPAAATTAGQQRRADSAAPNGGGAKGMPREEAKGIGSKLKDLSLGTWNVQGLGWGLLQMLLGAA